VLSGVHSINTRSTNHHYVQIVNMHVFGKVDIMLATKIFKRLARTLATLMYEKALFKVTLRRLLNTHSCY